MVTKTTLAAGLAAIATFAPPQTEAGTGTPTRTRTRKGTSTGTGTTHGAGTTATGKQTRTRQHHLLGDGSKLVGLGIGQNYGAKRGGDMKTKAIGGDI